MLLCLSTYFVSQCGFHFSFKVSKEEDSVQFSSVTHSCLTLHDTMNHSTPGHLVHHQLSEFTQTHVH